jgi:hypothetical protein
MAGFVKILLQRNVQQRLKKSADVQGGPVLKQRLVKRSFTVFLKYTSIQSDNIEILQGLLQYMLYSIKCCKLFLQ